jgi:fumarate hydratase class II
MKFRKEKDTMGIVLIPENAYYGPQTQRAVENFPISGITLQPEFIYALGLIKKCAAEVNLELGLMEQGISAAISQAAQEIMAGEFADQFVVDIFQTGSGTSTNMNINEVIAVRANEIITGKKAMKSPVHPNDHVNLGQSSNDVIPTAIHIASLTAIKKTLIPSLDKFQRVLSVKSTEFKDVITRTGIFGLCPANRAGYCKARRH